MAREMPPAGPERDALVAQALGLPVRPWSTDNGLVWELIEVMMARMVGWPVRRIEVQRMTSPRYPWRCVIWGGGDVQLGQTPADALSQAVLYELDMAYHQYTPW